MCEFEIESAWQHANVSPHTKFWRCCSQLSLDKSNLPVMSAIGGRAVPIAPAVGLACAFPTRGPPAMLHLKFEESNVFCTSIRSKSYWGLRHSGCFCNSDSRLSWPTRFLYGRLRSFSRNP